MPPALHRLRQGMDCFKKSSEDAHDPYMFESEDETNVWDHEGNFVAVDHHKLFEREDTLGNRAQVPEACSDKLLIRFRESFHREVERRSEISSLDRAQITSHTPEQFCSGDFIFCDACIEPQKIS